MEIREALVGRGQWECRTRSPSGIRRAPCGGIAFDSGSIGVGMHGVERLGEDRVDEDYDCESCGACCRCYPIFALEGDALREPQIAKNGIRCDDFLGKKGEVAYRLHPLPFLDACAFLGDDQLCRIYETRPELCRRFEPGSSQCVEARERVGVGRPKR